MTIWFSYSSYFHCHLSSLPCLCYSCKWTWGSSSSHWAGGARPRWRPPSRYGRSSE